MLKLTFTISIEFPNAIIIHVGRGIKSEHGGKRLVRAGRKNYRVSEEYTYTSREVSHAEGHSMAFSSLGPTSWSAWLLARAGSGVRTTGF